MSVEDAAVAKLAEHCRQVLGPPADWPDSVARHEALALCVLDALWSPDGQSDAVETAEFLALYGEMREEEWGEAESDGARDLLSQFEVLGGPASFAEKVKQRMPSSSSRRNVLNAAAAAEAAELLVGADVLTTVELRAASPKVLGELERAWKRIAGQRSGESFYRMLRLAGCPTVTADRRLVAFIGGVLGTEFEPQAVGPTMSAVAAELGVPVQALAHRIRTASG